MDKHFYDKKHLYQALGIDVFYRNKRLLMRNFLIYPPPAVRQGRMAG